MELEAATGRSEEEHSGQSERSGQRLKAGARPGGGKETRLLQRAKEKVCGDVPEGRRWPAPCGHNEESGFYAKCDRSPQREEAEA